jgi:hypothetical protein
MLGNLFKQLKIKKSIKERDWSRDMRLLQSGVFSVVIYNR